MGQSWQTGRPLPIPLGSSVVFQQVDLRAAFCQPRPRLSLIEMLWGCIGKVATPLPKPLGSLCFLNETQKCKFFRCGSEVIRGFPSKVGFGTKTEPFSTRTCDFLGEKSAGFLQSFLLTPQLGAELANWSPLVHSSWVKCGFPTGHPEGCILSAKTETKPY